MLNQKQATNTLSWEHKKAILLSSLGGLLEFYDFVIYALFSSYISQEFFPSDHKLISMMSTFAVFAVGYLIRPLGGIIFGHIGDKHGRKKTFLLTVWLMAIATTLMGLMPTYHQIGISATVIFVLLRMLQGLSLGGEIPGSVTFICETIPKCPGFSTGIIFLFILNGIVLGELMHATFSSLLTHEQMLSYGWRIPFVIGGVLGGISYLLRKKLHETNIYQQAKAKQVSIPFVDLFTHHLKEVITGCLISSIMSAVVVVLFLYLPTYLTSILDYKVVDTEWKSTLTLFVGTILIALIGWSTDRINAKVLLLITSIALLVLAYPIFNLLVGHSHCFILILFINAIFLGAVFGIIPVTLAKLFPANVRFSGIAFCYNFAFATFGGLAPLTATFLIQQTGLNQAPSFYLIGVAIVALIGTILLFSIKKMQLQNLD